MKIARSRKNRGDTIIEVLIAVTVLAAILTGAYALANHSSQGTRQAQERGEASKLARSQIELYKHYIATPGPANLIPPDGSIFCVKPDGTLDIFTNPLPPSNAQDELNTAFSEFNGHSCTTGLYHSYIKREGNTYTAHTRWNAVTGHGIDEVTMVYRVYPDLVPAN